MNLKSAKPRLIFLVTVLVAFSLFYGLFIVMGSDEADTDGISVSTESVSEGDNNTDTADDTGDGGQDAAGEYNGPEGEGYGTPEGEEYDTSEGGEYNTPDDEEYGLSGGGASGDGDEYGYYNEEQYGECGYEECTCEASTNQNGENESCAYEECICEEYTYEILAALSCLNINCMCDNCECDDCQCIAFAPFTTDLTPFVTVLDWGLYEAGGQRWSDTYPAGGIQYRRQARFWFSWEVNLPSGMFIQDQNLFSIRRPMPAEIGHFAMINSNWTDFFDSSNNLLGQTRVQSNHVEIRFSDYAIGEQTISGTFTTGYTVESRVARGGLQNVEFGTIVRPLYFRQRVSGHSNGVRTITGISTSGSRMSYAIYTNIIGLRELAGNPNSGFHGAPTGANFTTRDNFTVIHDLIPGSRFVSANFLAPPTKPANTQLPNLTYATNLTSGSRTIPASEMPRVWPLAGESRNAFIARVQSSPFQWGVWPAPLQGQSAASVPFAANQTLIAYFGTLGVDGPRITELGAGNNFSANARMVIDNGYFGEEMYNDLVAWFTAMYGNGNVINGRIPEVRIALTVDFPAAVVPTLTGPLTATITSTNPPLDVTITHTGGTLQPIGAAGELAAPDRARLYLIDPDLPTANWFLNGAAFQLQQLVSGSWVNVAGRVYNTGANGAGSFDTGILPAGTTLRFIQVTGPSAPPHDPRYETFWPLSPDWNSAEGAIISPTFTRAGSAQSRTVTIRNVLGELHEVTYTVTGIAPATFTPAIPAPANHLAGETVTVRPVLTTTATTSADGRTGTWAFSGWSAPNVTVTSGTFTMPAQNVAFTGSWTFTANNDGGGNGPGNGGGAPTYNLITNKSSNPAHGSYVIPGDIVTYNILVQNTGNGASGTVVITDTIPQGMSLVPNSAITRINGVINTGIAPNISGGTLTWNIPSIAPGAIVEVSFRVTVTSLGSGYRQTFFNTAVVNGRDTNRVELTGVRLIKNPDRMIVRIGDTINWTLRGFGNPTGEAVRNFGIVDMPGRGLNFQSARLPAFTNGAGVTYDISYRVAGSSTWRTHRTGVDASRPFTFNLPQNGNTHYTEISFYFGNVPAGFAVGDEIVITFIVGPGAPNNQLINRFFLSYSNIEREGESPDIPVVVPDGGSSGGGNTGGGSGSGSGGGSRVPAAPRTPAGSGTANTVSNERTNLPNDPDQFLLFDTDTPLGYLLADGDGDRSTTFRVNPQTGDDFRGVAMLAGLFVGFAASVGGLVVVWRRKRRRL